MKFLIEIKRLFFKCINLFGYKVVGIKKIVKHNNLDSIIYYLLENNKFAGVGGGGRGKKTIFDIGANKGQSIERFKKIFDKYLIYSFEPNPYLFTELKKNYFFDKNIILLNFGLSNKTSIENFHIYKNDRISSFISADKKSKFYLSRSMPFGKKNFEKIIKVKLNKLDNFAKKYNIKNIDILKIDTQGLEDKVLEGSKKLLENNVIKIIELELILGFAYKKILTFFDIEKFLNKYKYKLICIGSAGNIVSYSEYCTNLIYVNHKIYNKIKKIHYKNISIKNVTKKISKESPYTY